LSIVYIIAWLKSGHVPGRVVDVFVYEREAEAEAGKKSKK
jgi:hypothetical protein